MGSRTTLSPTEVMNDGEGMVPIMAHTVTCWRLGTKCRVSAKAQYAILIII